MHRFKDTEGREWLIVIKLGTLVRLRDQFQLDFLKDERTLAAAIGRLQMEPELLARTLFLLVGKQAVDQGVIEADFFDVLAGDVIADATKAFIDELAFFFQNSPRGRVLTEAVSAVERAMDRAAAKTIELMRSPQVMTHVDQAVEEAGRSYLNSLESSASPGETSKS